MAACVATTARAQLKGYRKAPTFVLRQYHTNEPFILANQATRIFFLEDTFARSDDWRVVQRFEQRNSFNEVAEQDDAYTAPDVKDNTDVPNIFENHHVNDAGEKIAYHAVDIQELIKKTPTFEDVEDEEDDTVGNYGSD